MNKHITQITTVFLLVVSSFMAFAQTSTESSDSSISESAFSTQNSFINHQVIRFEQSALLSISYDFGELSPYGDFYLVSEDNTIFYPTPTTNAWNEVVFNPIYLDKNYTIYLNRTGDYVPIAVFDTYDHTEDEFSASAVLMDALARLNEQDLETRPQVMDYIFAQPGIPFFEKVAFYQAFYDLPVLDKKLLLANQPINIFSMWQDFGNPLDSFPSLVGAEVGPVDPTLELFPTHPGFIDPNKLDPCYCQYTLKNSGVVNNEEDVRNRISDTYKHGIEDLPKRYFNIGAVWSDNNTGTHEHIKKGFVGPAKSVDYTLRGKNSPDDEKAPKGEDGNLSNTSISTGTQTVEIEMILQCDKLPLKILNRLANQYTLEGMSPPLPIVPIPPSSCLCQKEIELCYSYNAKGTIETTAGGSLVNESKASITAQDYAVATYYDGTTQTLEQTILNLEAKCEGKFIDRLINVEQIIDNNAEIGIKQTEINLKQAEVDNETDPVKKGLLQLELAKLRGEMTQLRIDMLQKLKTGQGLADDCDSDEAPVQMADCIVKTLKANTPTRFKISSDYNVTAEGSGTFYANATIKSDFHLTAVMFAPQVRPEDKYCCSKKWARYILGGYSGSLLGLSGQRNAVGTNLARYSNWDAPYSYLLYNLPTNQKVVNNDYGVLTGYINCDDLIFNNARNAKQNILEEKYEVSMPDRRSIKVVINQSDLEHNSDLPYTIRIFDTYGKTIAELVTKQNEYYFNDLALRKGLYFVSITQGENQVIKKVINYE